MLYNSFVSYLAHFNINPSMETFQERKKLQKLAYLMREAGLDVPFGFSWYLYGPYSPGLTEMLFQMVEQKPQGKVLTREERKHLEDLKQFLGEDVESTKRLELLASLQYLRRVAKDHGYAKNEIIAVLKKKKPQFSDDEIGQCWNKLERFPFP
jgi:uncharacterized protein YwgA